MITTTDRLRPTPRCASRSPRPLQDTFLNRLAANYQLTFAWPASDDVVEDTKALEIRGVALHGGHLEIDLSEELDLATATAIQVDGAPLTWTLSADRYTLRSSGELSVGAHTLSVATSLADLNGITLASAFNQTFTSAAHAEQAMFEAPDPRESPASTIGNLFGFQGLLIEPETGLIYVRNRYYDPEMGRFVTVDPLAYTDGPNLYGFAINDPVNERDPLGLATWEWHHMLPQAVFRGNNSKPSYLSQLKLQLASEVDIDSAEFGRIMEWEAHPPWSGDAQDGLQQLVAGEARPMEAGQSGQHDLEQG